MKEQLISPTERRVLAVVAFLVLLPSAALGAAESDRGQFVAREELMNPNTTGMMRDFWDMVLKD